jgi:hypothetical protein
VYPKGETGDSSISTNRPANCPLNVTCRRLNVHLPKQPWRGASEWHPSMHCMLAFDSCFVDPPAAHGVALDLDLLRDVPLGCIQTQLRCVPRLSNDHCTTARQRKRQDCGHHSHFAPACSNGLWKAAFGTLSSFLPILIVAMSPRFSTVAGCGSAMAVWFRNMLTLGTATSVTLDNFEN